MSRTRKRAPKQRTHANHYATQPMVTCGDGQCVRTVNMPSTTSSTLPLNIPVDESISPVNDSYLASILPRDYYEAMLESAKYGLLYSFVASTPVEFFNHHYKVRQMTPNQIYYANQAIRATAYLGLSVYLGFLDLKSLMIALGAPVSSALLKYQGCSDIVAQLAPAVAAAAVQIATDIDHYGKTALTLMAGIGGTLLGTSLAKKAYSYTTMGLFKLGEIISTALENEPESTFRQPI